MAASSRSRGSVLLQPEDDPPHALQPAKPQVGGGKEGLLPVPRLLDPFPQHQVVGDLEAKRFMAAHPLVRGPAHQVEGSDADVEVLRRRIDRPCGKPPHENHREVDFKGVLPISARDHAGHEGQVVQPPSVQVPHGEPEDVGGEDDVAVGEQKDFA